MKGIIRPATPADAGSIAKIYAPYVENTVISFEYFPPDKAQMRGRITQTSSKYPYLVYEYDGIVVGYAYASAYNPRAAYDWSVTSSIYLSSGHQRNGIGSALYGALFELLYIQGFFNVYAIIVYPHEQSISFHKKHGFSEICIMKKCGYKFDMWHDLMIMEKKLRSEDAQVENIIPFPQLDFVVVKDVLDKYKSRV